MRFCQGPPFWKFGRRFNPPPKQKGGGTLCNCLLLTLPPLTRFSPGLFVLQETLYQPFFALIRLLQKIMPFQSKTNFLFWFLILLFCVYVFLGSFFTVLHHETLNSFIFAYIHSFLFDLSPDKRINGHSVKITSCCCFFGFQGN